MDVREQKISSDLADKLSQKTIDNSIEIELDISKPGERKIFMDTFAKEIIAYLSGVTYVKSKYDSDRMNSRQGGGIKQYFYSMSRLTVHPRFSIWYFYILLPPRLQEK